MATADVRLVIFARGDDVAAAAMERHGLRVGVLSAGGPAPWPIYRAMEAADVYPPTAVVLVGDTVADVTAAVNAGVWAVGVTDGGREMGLTAEAFAALSDDERERRREPVRAAFFEAGADGVVDSPAELPGVIDELNRVLAETDDSGE